jgi:dipeptide/tripeptide permease
MTSSLQSTAGDRHAFRVAGALCVVEWAAFFCVYVSLTLYLTRAAGFTDVETGWVLGGTGVLACLLPTAAGLWADRVGYRAALLVAYSLLASGYAVMFLLPGRGTAVLAILAIVTGGAITRTSLMGTGAAASDESGRAQAYSILMQLVNAGCFVGKAVARPIRVGPGVEWTGAWALGAALVALAVVAFAYRRPPPRRPAGDGLLSAWRGVGRVMRNGRFLVAIVLCGVFWSVQVQLYATMPRYLTRLVGETASPEWYANVNPIVVVLLIVPITRATRRLGPVAAIAISLVLVTLSSTVMGLGGVLAARTGPELALPFGLSLHPQAAVMIAGAALSGLGECFLLPRFLEFASRLAPPGETSLYIGYGYLNGLVANVLGYGLSGYLMDLWCPDPATLPPPARLAWERAVAGLGPMPEAYARAPWIWFVFAGIGASAVGVTALGIRSSRARTGRATRPRPGGCRCP